MTFCPPCWNLVCAQCSPLWLANLGTKQKSCAHAVSRLAIKKQWTWARQWTISNRWGDISRDTELRVFCRNTGQNSRSTCVGLFLPHELHNSTSLSYLINLENELTECWVGGRKRFKILLFYGGFGGEPHWAMSFLLPGWLNAVIPNRLRKGGVLPWEPSSFAHSFRRAAGQLHINCKSNGKVKCVSENKSD